MNKTAPKKREYGRINEKILAAAIGRGMTQLQAGKLAGAKGTDKQSIYRT